EGGRLRFVQDLQLDGFDLDLARGDFPVDRIRVALADLAPDRDDGLVAELRGLVMDLLVAVGAEEHLRLALAIAEIDEDQVAEVAAHVDPAVEDDRLSDVRRPQFPAGVGSLQFPHGMTIPAYPTTRSYSPDASPLVACITVRAPAAPFALA